MATSNILRIVNDFKNNVDIDRSLVLKIAAGTTVGLAIGYSIKIWYAHGYFKRRGIKTPKYSFIYGNMSELMKNGYSETLMKWSKEYGKTFGYYEGHLPVMVTSDLELIEEIFYKQFSSFTARRRAPFQIGENFPPANLFISSRNRWKRMRSIINPTFSPAKLKELVPQMRKCSDRLVQVIEKHIGETIKISDFYDRMTMDVVWNGAYGIDKDFQSNPDFPFLRRTIEHFQNITNLSGMLQFLTVFYELKLIPIIFTGVYTFFASKISNRLGNPFFWIRQQIHQVLSERLQNKASKKDYLQILIDSQSENIDVHMDFENYDSSMAQHIEKKMSYDELLMNLMIFLFAGFETTSTTLTFCTYYLAKYPEEMEKLQKEIDDSGIEEFDYDNINKLEYLDMFIKEIQRMEPIANFVIARRCTKPVKIKGYSFEEDQVITADVFSLHFNPEYWGEVDPKVFYPLRFSDPGKINKLAYMPFGAGPRICVGMKFALLEIKLTLAKLLKKYDILAPPTGLADPHFSEYALRKMLNGVSVLIRKRSD